MSHPDDEFDYGPSRYERAKELERKRLRRRNLKKRIRKEFKESDENILFDLDEATREEERNSLEEGFQLLDDTDPEEDLPLESED